MNKQPDKPEKIIRFGCGAVFGFIFGFYLFDFWLYSSSFFTLITAAGLLAFILGGLAVRYGDYFWERLKDWIWWLQFISLINMSLGFTVKVSTGRQRVYVPKKFLENDDYEKF